MTQPKRVPPSILSAVFAISFAVLAYQVLLMRLFAIVQWHHFAYMAISIALLGFGASGTFLFLARAWIQRRFAAAFVVNALFFGISGLAGFALAQHLPFNPLEVVWRPTQLLYLLAFYALFTVPFFAGANCIGLTFQRYAHVIGRVYAVNLVGSGLGALGMIAALMVLAPQDILKGVAALGVAAAAGAALRLARHRGWVAVAVVMGAALVLVLPPSWLAPVMSPYKSLSMALNVPGAQVIAERSSPLSLLSVVQSPTVPFRHAPGLSLLNQTEPPAQLGIFADGGGPMPITAFSGDLDALGYLGYTTSALPYHLLSDPEVLVLGAGGGADVLQALYHGAHAVDAVELDPGVVRLVQDTHRTFAGDLYGRPDVRVHVADARAFVTASSATWDLIQIPLLDSFAAGAAGVHGLSESYVYTLEAFETYLSRLKPGGYLAVTRWLKLPPRDSLKLFATALRALTRQGVTEPAGRIAMVRGWNTVTILVRAADIAPADVDVIRAFAARRAFDLAYAPGMKPEEANRFNILQEPYFHQATQALVGAKRERFLNAYKFDIRPATDDRPYFFDFFRWRSLGEFLALRSVGGAGMIEWGYPVLFATLVQATVLSAALILLPLWLRRRPVRSSVGTGRVMVYFTCLGLAFMFVEIAFIQRFILFLGHPVYAVAVVLAGFLVFAGMGSAIAPRFAAWAEAWMATRVKRGPVRALGPTGWAAGLVACGVLVYQAALPGVFAVAWDLGGGGRIALSLALIAPLAFFMGMPFPLGLGRVNAHAPRLVAWAWGVNGCFSVIGAIGATILAVHFGFGLVIAAAALLYALAGVVGVTARAGGGESANKR